MLRICTDEALIIRCELLTYASHRARSFSNPTSDLECAGHMSVLKFNPTPRIFSDPDSTPRPAVPPVRSYSKYCTIPYVFRTSTSATTSLPILPSLPFQLSSRNVSQRNLVIFSERNVARRLSINFAQSSFNSYCSPTDNRPPWTLLA